MVMIVSIFNDVIGPMMRGPSSSHCAAALRIGRLARDLMSADFTVSFRQACKIFSGVAAVTGGD